ncbi:MAG: FAD/NAD(P)-binding protein [Corynebacterium sp.]|uniref:FAD/NAD(P)-binding protein n=1 Tax=Corynebacterium sp. TaxID=1720 RepID=UPI003F94881F
MTSLVVVGGGPRTTGLLLALAARLREQGDPGGRDPLDIHVVDPFLTGPGRIWRADQPSQVWMNNTSDQITVYAGGDPALADVPPISGPSLADWVGRGAVYVPRRDAASYLRDAFERAVGALPEWVTVTEHRNAAVGVGRAEGERVVLLDDGTALRADATVLAQGHLDVLPGTDGVETSGHTPPGYTVDQDFSHIPGGADVLVRGFGLAFIDLMMLVTEGRGGRFGHGADGIVYHPSGREPVLWVGSRRGVPYRSKLVDGPPQLTPRHLTEDTLRRLPRSDGGVLQEGVLRSLLLAEINDAWYTALAEHHGQARITVTAERIHALTDAWVDRLVDADVPGAGREEEAFGRVVRGAVPAPEDRLDLRHLDRPLEGRTFADHGDLEQAVEDIVVGNLQRAHSRRFPQDGALYSVLVASYFVAHSLLFAGALAPADRELVASLTSTFSYVCSGPPPERLENLVALHRAGLVRFLGAGAEFGQDGSSGRYTATGGITADYLVDARLAELTADRVADPLLRGLLATGDITADTTFAVDAHDRAVGADGVVRDDLFLIGPTTSSPVREGFGRPGEPTRVFPANDALAAALLDALRGDQVQLRERRGVPADIAGQ